MKILHLFKSPPDGEARLLADGMSRGMESAEIPLHEGTVDYDDVVKQVFENDRVVCWW